MAAEVYGATASIETRDDLGTDAGSVVRFWLQQLRLAEKEDREFVRRGRAIVKRYRDERGMAENYRARMNILWSNVETLKPVLYGRQPKPVVELRHVDQGNPTERLGVQILERALSYEDDIEQFDKVMKLVVEDRLLPGRGTARVFYECTFGEPEPDPDAGEDGELQGDEGEGGEQEPREPAMITPVEDESAPVRYVFWEDYRESPARTEEEVWWKAYRSYLTRDELVKRFGSKIGKQVTLDYSPKGLGDFDQSQDGPLADAFKKAQVWEIWDSVKKEAVWVAPSYTDAPLDKRSDPLELPGFFPSPRALKATTTNEKTVPVADYKQYQDQAEQLDTLTARIDKLTQALMVKGVYAASSKADLQQLFDTGIENQLIPVEDWAMFAGDKGGLQGQILWLPIEQIAKVALSLYDARDRALRVLYQITGIADILRGETDPNETMGAQTLKSQYATRRISEAQKDVARFARDLMRLRGSVIATHFAAETLSEMSGFPQKLPELPPAPPMMIPAPEMPPMAAPATGAPPGGVLPSPPPGGLPPQVLPPRPPMAVPPGARQAPDGRHYLPDPRRPGKFLMVA